MTDKKKPTRKKQASKGSVLLQLHNNKLLSSKVNEALDTNKTYDEIMELCAEYEFEISKATLSRYKDKREEAIKKGIPLEEVLDGRVKSKVVSIAGKEVKSPVETRHDKHEKEMSAQDTLYSDIELLDDIIQKGFNGMQYVSVVDPQIAMKAIELKKKITGDSLQGMSVAGLKELNLRNLALQNSLTEVLFKYIPEDKHEEVIEYIDQVEEEFYNNLDLTEEDRRLNEALKNTTKLGG